MPESTSKKTTGVFQDETDAYYDRLASLAVKALKVPVAFVTFLEPHRQVFRGRCAVGPLEGATESPISHSICKLVADRAAPLIIDDARTDPRVTGHLAVSDLQVIAYAGIPIYDEKDRPVGAMCAIDHQPKKWSPEDVEILNALAAQVSSDLTLRAAGKQLEDHFFSLQAVESQRALETRADRHDLRTPLNAMMLGIQAVGQLGDLNEDQKECISLAERNAEVLLSMIDQMLDIAKIDRGGEHAIRQAVTNPAALVKDALTQVSAIAREKQLTLLGGSNTQLSVAVDRDKILRVLVNLLGNAVKFTPPGGEITFHAEEVAGEAGSPSVKFSVSDTGIGISSEKIPRIFDEGFMVDSESKTRRSTGLGLTFCKRVVEAHDSELCVKSVPGEGSVFWFSLKGVA